MKKFTCALVALLGAALFLPAPTVTAAALPERATVRDALGDVRGSATGKHSIDISTVSGTRIGNYLIGRMKVANVHNDVDRDDGQLFVLWIETRGGVLYHVSARNKAAQEAPVRGDGDQTFCATEDVKLNWGVDTDVIVWKLPMRCFKEHPVAWRVGGISFIGRNQDAWDQTGGRRNQAKLSPLFANTP